jgi:hypothetical protein
MKKSSFLSNAIQGFWLMSVLSLSLMAAAPTYINYQGKLTDIGGVPVNTFTPVVFNFYDDETGGILKHSSSMNISPSNGLFSVLIPVPADLFIVNPELYLAIDVNSSGEFSARQRLAAAPYALAVAAGSVGPNELAQEMVLPNTIVVSSITADVMINAGQLRTGGTLPVLDGSNLTGLQATSIAPGAVGTNEISDGAVTNEKISGMSVGKLVGDFPYIYETNDGRLILGNEYRTAMCGISPPSTPLFYNCAGACEEESPALCQASALKGKLIPSTVVSITEQQ